MWLVNLLFYICIIRLVLTLWGGRLYDLTSQPKISSFICYIATNFKSPVRHVDSECLSWWQPITDRSRSCVTALPLLPLTAGVEQTSGFSDSRNARFLVSLWKVLGLTLHSASVLGFSCCRFVCMGYLQKHLMSADLSLKGRVLKNAECEPCPAHILL